MLKKVKFENNMRLQHLVFGYKILDKEYFHLNYFLTILAFTIWKSYYVSEQKTKETDVYLLFKNEFLRKMKENKLLGINSLFNQILLYMNCEPTITNETLEL